MKQGFIYTEEHKDQISFPLGGIGSGCIGLTGNGRLKDWEIFNRPNKGSYNGFSHFAIKAENENEVIDSRVLQGDLPTHYVGLYSDERYRGYGFGPDRQTMAGFPSFKDVTFKGEFPLATVTFKDKSFPGKIDMTAFNPFIPMNDKDSSIPGAFFEFEVENTSEETLKYSICLSLQNPLLHGSPVNVYSNEGGFHIMNLKTNGLDNECIDYGELCMATDVQEASYQEYWYRGSWFDEVGIFWKEFSSQGTLKNRSYEKSIENIDNGSSSKRSIDTASLCGVIEIKPGEKKSIRFSLTWNFPNYVKYWGKEEGSKENMPKWKNYYAKLFESAKDSAIYSLEQWNRLYKETLLFKDTLFDSTLPEEAIDAVSANISILKSPTCLRLENGEFYGWEGVMSYRGSCEGSCTHVWNYAYALPFLFPNLERSMRDLDYTYNLREDGGMPFRLQLPLGSKSSTFRPCVDGQLGGVLKVYREWKISGDDDWLRNIWPKVKKSLEYAWSEKNYDQWDPDKTGVLWGRQHHTLDMELFGPNSWLTGFYLIALKAATELANYLGENETAKEYLKIFEKGKDWTDKNLFNGKYYHQLIDLKDKSILDQYNNESLSLGGYDIFTAYWSDEHSELKYQIGEGSAIDQVVASWHANLCGVGEIFDPEQTKEALKSLYKYNFKENMRDFYNPCRLYSLYDEAGIVICDWPEDKYKPVVPVPYSEETMNGFEYQSAIHMIQEGMIEEGMNIVKAIRERYNGFKRNPWNEFECGSNYARSMASYALLLAFSGFSYHMPYRRLGFNPVITEKDFKSFWSIDGAWGNIEINKEQVILKVLYGSLEIRQLELSFIDQIKEITLNREELEYAFEEDKIIFQKEYTVNASEEIIITL
ncbi:GH116 family glycosyl-hydrolase [Vallitalea okinawensis]|uniref:GH116 family glycosyl-hydrolase n=1 Tax=Vallitalea okinawensis TaxID=2078660 RepID=UPI000CFDFCA9|nr:GH116 family glycosyl-hydrolase [Vallitalea okinawensis]